MLIIAGAASVAHAASGNKADEEYQALAAKAAAGDLSVDFRAMRLACAEADKCDSRGDDKDAAALQKAARAKRHEEVIKIAKRLIAAGFPNIEAHAACASAYAALGKPEEAAFHQQVTSGLLRSIFKTGDGKSKETAFEVIGTHEERIVMMVLGLPPFGRQALSPGKPHNYDIIEVEDPRTKQQVSVYFNIDAFYPMKAFRSLQ